MLGRALGPVFLPRWRQIGGARDTTPGSGARSGAPDSDEGSVTQRAEVRGARWGVVRGGRMWRQQRGGTGRDEMHICISISHFFADATARITSSSATLSFRPHACHREFALWNKTLFIINYDEHGGYFEHGVLPPADLRPDSTRLINPNEPQFDGYQHGFRGPMIAISPYAKKDFISYIV
ncbi:hypothetical protein JB92DRAFT_3118350 [Gautieria morchelliformis]|nr:hypothetical protein JB92DRAFT_3118350 [Gautieria morchelliformis]